jgi:hypothetical protein
MQVYYIVKKYIYCEKKNSECTLALTIPGFP